MEPELIISNHLVKSEDLNHHGTLYAGRNAEWFVESGFIAAAKYLNPESIVCLKIHGMTFTHPVKCGDITTYHSKIIYTGTSSLIAFVEMLVNGNLVVRGFITFIHVDKDSKPVPHGIQINTKTEEEKDLQKEAIALSKAR